MTKQNTILRLCSYIFRKHKWRLVLVVIGILLSAYATVAGASFLEALIDDYIAKLVEQQNPDFLPLLGVNYPDGCHLCDWRWGIPDV